MASRPDAALRAAVLAVAAALVVTGCAASEQRTGPGRGEPARGGASAAPFTPFAERLVDQRLAMYPRLVRLRDGRIVLSVAAGSGAGVTDMARFYESADGGRTFRMLSEILDPAAERGRGACCGSLLELPRRIGAQPAGTLLWAGTVGMKNHAPGRRPELRVWRSTDGGRHWAYLSSCAIAPEGTPWDEGLWEPELGIDGRGRVVCYYSDETRGPAQVIVEAASPDGGATWEPGTVVVAPGPDDRPGMPVVRRLPDGSHFMTYEVCGPTASCKVHYRRSPDGWTWGSPAALGTVARSAGGRNLYHAPTVTWLPGGGPRGTILLVGGVVRDARGVLMRPASGATLFANTAGGSGDWREIPAPVRVPFPAYPEHSDIVCGNYSSSLLPVGDGKGLLEAATKRGKDGTCQVYVAASAWAPPPAELKTA